MQISFQEAELFRSNEASAVSLRECTLGRSYDQWLHSVILSTLLDNFIY